MKKITLLFSLIISFTGFSQTTLREYTFPDAGSVTATQIRSTTPDELINVIPIADGSSPDASFSYSATGNPTGALNITGVNAAEGGVGRNFGYRINDDKIDYQGASKLTVSFDIKRVGSLVESAVNLQLQIPRQGGGVITVNQFNLENRPDFGETYLRISFDIDQALFDNTTKLLIIDFAIASSPTLGSGGTILIDNLLITGTTVVPTCSDGIKNGDETGMDCGGTTCLPCVTPVPLVSAPLSSTPDSDVLFLYSDVYTFTPVSFLNPTWAVTPQSNYSAPSTEVVIAATTDKVRYFENAGLLFMQIPVTDVRAYRYFHIDIWSPNSTFAIVKWEGAGAAIEGNIPVNLVPNQWNSVDIDLNTFGSFGTVANREFMFQLVIDAAGGNDYYFDNIYFSKSPFTLGTEKFKTSSVKMYPNPVKNTLTIEAKSEIQRVSVYSILGQEVLKSSPKSNSVTLQTNELQKGVYMVTTEIDGKVSTSKVIKE
jgi:Secretion system C-terminal sorting domain